MRKCGWIKLTGLLGEEWCVGAELKGIAGNGAQINLRFNCSTGFSWCCLIIFEGNVIGMTIWLI